MKNGWWAHVGTVEGMSSLCSVKGEADGRYCVLADRVNQHRLSRRHLLFDTNTITDLFKPHLGYGSPSV